MLDKLETTSPKRQETSPGNLPLQKWLQFQYHRIGNYPNPDQRPKCGNVALLTQNHARESGKKLTRIEFKKPDDSGFAPTRTFPDKPAFFYHIACLDAKTRKVYDPYLFPKPIPLSKYSKSAFNGEEIPFKELGYFE